MILLSTLASRSLDVSLLSGKFRLAALARNQLYPQVLAWLSDLALRQYVLVPSSDTAQLVRLASTHPWVDLLCAP